jgi:hypothetical protein
MVRSINVYYTMYTTQSQRVLCKADGSLAQSHTKCTIHDSIPYKGYGVSNDSITRKEYYMKQMTQSQRVLCKPDGSLNQRVLYNVQDSITYEAYRVM